MIKAHPKKPDWWIVDRESALKYISGVPGIQIFDKTAWVHRTHLPLFGLRGRDLIGYNLEDIQPFLEPISYLRDYQNKGRRRILSQKGTLLAWQMRTGKTAVAASSWLGNGRLLVVAPLAVRPVWMQWIKKCHPGAKVAYVTGKKFDPEQIQGADAIFCHYNIMGQWGSMGIGRDIELLVLDEIHLLSNFSSNRSTGCMLASTFAKRIVGTTGTPIWNKPAGFFNVLDNICPGAFGNYWKFTARYTSGQKGEFGWVTGVPSNTQELQARLTEVMSILTWRDILGQVPNIQRSVEIADLTYNQRLELDKLQLVVGPAARSTIEIAEMARMRKLLGDIKADAAVSLAKDFLESESVVIWTWHKSVADAIHSKLKNAGFSTFMATGDDIDITPILDEWRKSPISALVITIGVGQVGIDLSKARHCIFAEIDYTPVVISQAAMRTFSPDHPCTETFILADHEVDRRLVYTILRKCREAFEMGVPAAESELDILRIAYEEDEPDLADIVKGLI